MELRGGLMYAGVDGYPTRQGQPLNNVAPRGGFAWSVTEKTVIRGGYGLYWVPPISDTGESAIGARGYSASTTFLSSTDGGLTPVGYDFESVSGRHRRRRRATRSAWPPARGSVIDFVDQDSKPGYVQQYSLDWQRELPGEMAIAFGYMGSRSERLSLGGTSDTTVNINQLDPQYQALGTALQQTVPNPFFGNRGVRQPEPLGDDRARPAAAAVPAVRQRADAPRQPGARPLQRARRALDQADVERLLARRQLHVQPPRGQPVRREQHVLQPAGERAEQLRPRRRVRRVAARRRAPAERQRHLPAAVRRGPQVAARAASATPSRAGGRSRWPAAIRPGSR